MSKWPKQLGQEGRRKQGLQKKTEEPEPLAFSPKIHEERVSGMLCCLRMWTRLLLTNRKMFTSLLLDPDQASRRLFVFEKFSNLSSLISPLLLIRFSTFLEEIGQKVTVTELPK